MSKTTELSELSELTKTSSRPSRLSRLSRLTRRTQGWSELSTNGEERTMSAQRWTTSDELALLETACLRLDAEARAYGMPGAPRPAAPPIQSDPIRLSGRLDQVGSGPSEVGS